ncbi:response regulator [Methylopila sp. M107]|uniref:response regulator n=1 Tax=Methylopila sp. M107 TaxID=1101190 RepID=UPI00035D2A67|nr:response regulator [Methylopila sp. M107]
MRILIVEDEPVIALEIEAIVLDRLPDAEISIATSVKAAFEVIDDTVSLAFLDIDVADGKTYSLALELRLRHVPFVFVSGANRDDAPDGLAEERLVPKPFAAREITQQLEALAREADGEAN